MNTKTYHSLLLLSIAVAFFSCTKTEFDEFEVASGNADFSNYVAVGNSLTQGYQDGGLHNEFGQHENSYPAMLAKQFKLIHPNLSYLQPTVQGNGSGYMHLKWENEEIKVIKVYDSERNDNHPDAIKNDPSWETWGNKSLKYNNLGVSGFKLANVVAGGNTSASVNYFVSNVNPYARFLNWGTTSNMVSYLDHIKNSNATFFTNWLGNNDVLGWSTGGGDDGYEAQVNEYFSKLTDVTEFSNKYDSVLLAFKNMGAKGVCATIPDVTSIPYFKTVTLEAIGGDVWITEGPYSNNPGNVRKATNEDLILLTASDELAIGNGLSQNKPLDHTFVLDKDEKAISQSTVIAYNNVIRSLAASYGFAVADMYEFMRDLESGLVFDGIDFSPEFVAGGVFSLDGVHPNTRGYALIANKFIDVINQHYSSTIPQVVVGDYRGVTFP